MRARRSMEGCFRGSIAPASLKAGAAAFVFADDAGFPGLYCPGLIEGRPIRGRYLGLVAFPGLYCPGLIEGAGPSFVGMATGAVSGALLPRPH